MTVLYVFVYIYDRVASGNKFCYNFHPYPYILINSNMIDFDSHLVEPKPDIK
jgi:hypothetical protein